MEGEIRNLERGKDGEREREGKEDGSERKKGGSRARYLGEEGRGGGGG